jgi:hypothetical protein
MAVFVVLPELLAMGPTFRIGGDLSVHIRDVGGRSGAVDVQLEAALGGRWGFVHEWSQANPPLLEEWVQELVLSLNRMAAEGMTQAEVWMPSPGSLVPARR